MWEADFGRKPPLKTAVIAISDDLTIAAPARRADEHDAGRAFSRVSALLRATSI
jgi:hypothetical protein